VDEVINKSDFVGNDFDSLEIIKERLMAAEIRLRTMEYFYSDLTWSVSREKHLSNQYHSNGIFLINFCTEVFPEIVKEANKMHKRYGYGTPRQRELILARCVYYLLKKNNLVERVTELTGQEVYIDLKTYVDALKSGRITSTAALPPSLMAKYVSHPDFKSLTESYRIDQLILEANLEALEGYLKGIKHSKSKYNSMLFIKHLRMEKLKILNKSRYAGIKDEGLRNQAIEDDMVQFLNIEKGIRKEYKRYIAEEEKIEVVKEKKIDTLKM